MSSHRPRINKSKPEIRIGVQLNQAQVAMLVAALVEFKERPVHPTPFGPKVLSVEGLMDCKKLLELFHSLFKMFPDNGKEK